MRHFYRSPPYPAQWMISILADFYISWIVSWNIGKNFKSENQFSRFNLGGKSKA